MEGRILSKVEDVESDGGTLAWHAIKFSDVPGVMDDDRQLSSDLEKHLRLNKDEPMEEQELMVRRGPDGHLVIKKENEGQPCAGHQGIGLGFGFNMPTNSSYTSSAYTSSTQHASGVSPLVRPESNNLPWAIPSNPGSWRHDDSMSSFDLEMDKEPSMTFSQVMSPPNIQEYTKAGIDSHFGYRGDTDFNQKKYMHENNLRRYAGDESENATNQQHQLWQQNIQHQQAAVTPDTGGFEEIYTFELDEFGEGPLHTLSAVSDELTLRESIKMLQTCNVVKQCINLQNKLKQTPLFLAVLQKNTALINWLLENGADPNIQGTLYTDRDEYIWRSPLHLAAMKGDDWLCVLQMILKSPLTNINLFSYGDKLSALHLALKCHGNNISCRNIILELVNKGADISVREQASSKSPFMLALETRDLNLVQEFLNMFPADRRRAILQEQTRSGDTCLHIAAGLSRISSQDKERLLRFLVIQGANGNVTNNVKELPRDFARKEWDNIRKT